MEWVKLFIYFSYQKTRMITNDVLYHHRGTWSSFAPDLAVWQANYIRMNDRAREVVPSDRYFEFDIKRDGWAELSRIVGLPVPPGNPPFPHPRSKDSLTNCNMM